MDDMPSSCNGGFQATVSLWNEWHWLKVQKASNRVINIVYKRLKLDNNYYYLEF